MVQPTLDYCSQLWSPGDQATINKLESVQRHLVNRIKDRALTGLNYWEKLKELRLYSQERRRERYKIIFLWKISQGLVSGFDVNFTSDGSRRGRMIIPNRVQNDSPAIVRKARENTLGVRGSRIFSIRTLNTQHIDRFKNNLDIFLENIPDQPTVTGLGRAAESNSLLHQLPLFYSMTS